MLPKQGLKIFILGNPLGIPQNNFKDGLLAPLPPIPQYSTATSAPPTQGRRDVQKRGAPAHLRTRRGGPPGLRGGVRWGQQGFEESRGEISSTCYALFRGDAGADLPLDPLGPCPNQDLCAPQKPQDGGLLPFFSRGENLHRNRGFTTVRPSRKWLRSAIPAMPEAPAGHFESRPEGK